MKEFYDLFEECVFIPKDSKYFCGDMDVKLLQIYPQILNRKVPVKYFTGHFMGIIENHDVMGVTTETGELTVNQNLIKSFNLIKS